MMDSDERKHLLLRRAKKMLQDLTSISTLDAEDWVNDYNDLVGMFVLETMAGCPCQEYNDANPDGPQAGCSRCGATPLGEFFGPEKPWWKD